MSIYPVKITEWYNKKTAYKTEVETLKILLPNLKCQECGNNIEWKKGYVMHSITFGGPDEAWCCNKCLNGERHGRQLR